MTLRPINDLRHASTNMFYAAITGDPKLKRNAALFFESASNNPGLALTAYHTEYKGLKKDFPNNELRRIIPAVTKTVESNYETGVWSNVFTDIINNQYSRSFNKRVALARSGAVRANDRVRIDDKGKSLGKLHRATKWEKFKASAAVAYNEIKNVLYSSEELKQLRKEAKFDLMKIIKTVK